MVQDCSFLRMNPEYSWIDSSTQGCSGVVLGSDILLCSCSGYGMYYWVVPSEQQLHVGTKWFGSWVVCIVYIIYNKLYGSLHKILVQAIFTTAICQSPAVVLSWKEGKTIQIKCPNSFREVVIHRWAYRVQTWPHFWAIFAMKGGVLSSLFLQEVLITFITKYYWVLT